MYYTNIFHGESAGFSPVFFIFRKAAYKAGIRREESENLDWDYGKDSRPLVNAFSKAIGYAGL